LRGFLSPRVCPNPPPSPPFFSFSCSFLKRSLSHLSSFFPWPLSLCLPPCLSLSPVGRFRFLSWSLSPCLSLSPVGRSLFLSWFLSRSPVGRSLLLSWFLSLSPVGRSLFLSWSRPRSLLDRLRSELDDEPDSEEELLNDDGDLLCLRLSVRSRLRDRERRPMVQGKV
jgi:hypothetical protein